MILPTFKFNKLGSLATVEKRLMALYCVVVPVRTVLLDKIALIDEIALVLRKRDPHYLQIDLAHL